MGPIQAYKNLIFERKGREKWIPEKKRSKLRLAEDDSVYEEAIQLNRSKY